MNKETPFFVIDAELLLKSHLFDIAINMCINGVSQYPLYLSGWLLLINAYKAAGKIEDANLTINKALNLFPDNRALFNLRDELNSNFFNITYSNKKNMTYSDDDNTDVEVVGTLIELDEESDSGEQEPQNIAYDNNLQELAKKLDEVSVPVKTYENITNNNDYYHKGIITETMANIYISQRAYSEAISAYRNLIKINPDKQEYYLDKINGLQSKL